MNAMVGQFGLTAHNSGALHCFRLEPHDRLIVDGKPYRVLRRTGENVELMPEDGRGLVEQFALSQLGRLNATGQIKHEVGYYLPDDLKSSPEVKSIDFRVSELPPGARRRFKIRHALVRATLDLRDEGKIRINTNDIEAHKSEIEKRASVYMVEEASERDLLDHEKETGRLPRSVEAKTKRRRGGSSGKTVSAYNADYLRKLASRYERHGPAVLADSLCKSGNRTSPFGPEEQALMMQTIKESYLTPERRPIARTVEDVKRAFAKENERRQEDGLRLLKVPGRDAVRGAIKKLDQFAVMVARYGSEYAMKEMRPVNRGLEVSRPGERVEIDEWCIDLISILHSAKLHAVLGSDFIEAIGLDRTKDRWWLVVAIDCRTRVILGMKLARNPSSSAAIECLRMVVSDKGQWADAVGALSPWSHAVVPETLVTDNGPAFRSADFTEACLDLKISVLRTIAGVPGMRGRVERFFRTCAMNLLPRLMGRTFSNPFERGDYQAEDRAALDAEGLAFALVRWIVDIYHNSPHEGLGGRTPLEQWDADMRDGNFPVRALPDKRSKRLAFGMKLKRHVDKTGVTILGVRYQGPELLAFRRTCGGGQVDVRWDPSDLGAIEVFLGDAWYEIHAVSDRFSGLDVHRWVKVRRTLRAKSQSRKAWEEEVVFKAIDDIETLIGEQSAAYGIMNTAISTQYLKHLEGSLFASFDIVRREDTTMDCADLGIRIEPREPDIDVAPGVELPMKVEVTNSADEDADFANKSQPPTVPKHPRKKQTEAPAKFWLPGDLNERSNDDAS